MPLGGYRGAG